MLPSPEGHGEEALSPVQVAVLMCRDEHWLHSRNVWGSGWGLQEALYLLLPRTQCDPGPAASTGSPCWHYLSLYTVSASGQGLYLPLGLAQHLARSWRLTTL